MRKVKDSKKNPTRLRVEKIRLTVLIGDVEETKRSSKNKDLRRVG